jgi:hypothetical protein
MPGKCFASDFVPGTTGICTTRVHVRAVYQELRSIALSQRTLFAAGANVAVWRSAAFPERRWNETGDGALSAKEWVFTIQRKFTFVLASRSLSDAVDRARLVAAVRATATNSTNPKDPQP